MINSITVSFGANATVNPNMRFTLVGSDDRTPNVGSAFHHREYCNGQTVVMLQFTGAQTNNGSLADGTYQLTYNNSVIGPTTFFRMFGDMNGDHLVNQTDLTAFNAAMRSSVGTAPYLWYFNYNQDCVIDAVDYRYFLMNYQP